jgi:uncharacterized membrane protein YfcA
MELEWYHYALAIAGGAMAGAINTLAGNGSAITLTILTELIGLPGNIANATNRIGIVAHSVAGLGAFYRNGKLRLGRSWFIIIIMVLGAIGGIFVAMQVSNEQFIRVFRFLMVFMLFVILVKPERWLRETDATRNLPLWVSAPLFLALGFYGGFIQMGMGIFFLGIMVLAARYSIIDSNVIKISVTAIYTILAVIIFQFNGMVSWPIGLVLAAGQAIGGYFTAHFASRHPKANLYAHRVLIIVVILSILQMFKVPAYLAGLFF